eukprot:Amastigsp_a842122_88.p4 type:complete len:101 gc:universal Amastigsp_a842122_88:360-58(-)
MSGTSPRTPSRAGRGMCLSSTTRTCRLVGRAVAPVNLDTLALLGSAVAFVASACVVDACFGAVCAHEPMLRSEPGRGRGRHRAPHPVSHGVSFAITCHCC